MGEVAVIGGLISEGQVLPLDSVAIKPPGPPSERTSPAPLVWWQGVFFGEILSLALVLDEC